MFEEIQTELLSHPNFHQNIGEALVLSLYFMPSFLNRFRLDILAEEETVFAEISLENSHQEILELKLPEFKSEILDLEILHLKDHIPLGLDGIIVSCLAKRGNEMNFFSYWSPENKSVYYTLSLKVFNLIFQHSKSEKILSYLEHLNDYFSFIPPYFCREYDDFQWVKIYGTLSWQFPFETDYPLQKKFEDSLNRLNPLKPILFDMSNFISIGGAYGKIFEQFFKKYIKTVLLLNETAVPYLRIIGYAGEYFSDRRDAMKKIQSLF